MKKNLFMMGLLIVLMVGVYKFIHSQKNILKSEAEKSITQNKRADTKKNDTRDLTFTNNMIEHHMGAIDMAQDAQKKSQRNEIKELSNNIIAAQKKEIEMMYSWKKNWYDDTKKIELQMQGHGSNMMQDLGMSDNEFDLRFINAMISHHQGAIDMASEILKTTNKNELKILANNIVKDQAKEIDQMSEWKKTWYNK